MALVLARFPRCGRLTADKEVFARPETFEEKNPQSVFVYQPGGVSRWVFERKAPLYCEPVKDLLGRIKAVDGVKVVARNAGRAQRPTTPVDRLMPAPPRRERRLEL